MAQQSQVPKFGNWESEEDVSYTAYFDNPRKGKKSSKVNQNDSHENLEIGSKGQKVSDAPWTQHNHLSRQEDGEMRRSTESPLHPDVVSRKPAIDSSHKWHGGVQFGSHKSESEAIKAQEMLRPRHHRRLSREEGDMRRLTDSPVRPETAGWRAASESPHHRHGVLSAGDTPRRVTRQSVGSDRSIEHSPLHPHSQARVGGNGSRISSPSWERKATSEGSYGLAPSTPGRSRLRSVTRGDDTPDHNPAVPKFGDWDETNPASAEGYTHIFNRVREEKNSDAGKVPVMPTETSYPNGQKQYGNDNLKVCGCFPWGKR
ncbi:RPM1-interacting protein 4 [Forsythia ovata]|uniref:RPM1-interacting protein 4 n=1 Tax=Forsythia ovata TaxID=205694 RepID=A0ABD1UXR5_9LAMI